MVVNGEPAKHPSVLIGTPLPLLRGTTASNCGSWSASVPARSSRLSRVGELEEDSCRYCTATVAEPDVGV